MSHETAKVLRAAADLVDRGWCQGDLAIDQHGLACYALAPEAAAWCALGSIDRAHYELGVGVAHEVIEALHGYIVLKDPVWAHDEVPGWNDSPRRTADEVAAALRGAADRVEQQG